MIRWATAWVLGLLALAWVSGAAVSKDKKKDKKPAEVFLDPKKAGFDFGIQGEYEGKIKGKGKLGAQVIALGDGKFEAVLYPGGLPGEEGWDGKTRIKLKGRLDRNPARSVLMAFFAGNNWTGKCIYSGGLGFQGTTAAKEEYSLKRVARKSPTRGKKPPKGAIVLFDGSSAKEWNGGKLVEGNLLNMGVTSKKTFTDFELHLEFRTPFRPKARGQERGNSGVYLQGRHEIQILDSFGLEARKDDCGAIYGQTAPSVNMCYPPLAWQTYDIDYWAPRFDASGKKIALAVVTVRHNGVKIHDKVEIKSSGRKAEAQAGPLHLQNHGNPVYFRNIWVVPKK
jgi:hypothetical protein